jgi:hypothetical protein
MTYLSIPVGIAIGVAVLIMAIKSKIVWDSFKSLMAGRYLLAIVFGLTIIFVIGLLFGPVANHMGYLKGTEDLSKELQMDQKPLEAHHHGD